MFDIENSVLDFDFSFSGFFNGRITVNNNQTCQMNALSVGHIVY